MKTKKSTPQIVQQGTSEAQSLSPQQIWLHLSRQQQETIVQRITQACWAMVQTAKPEQEVAHVSQ